jgi:hypothetical protein
MKVLIFTPIAEHKEYCLQAFIDNVKKFTYANFEHIFVDNSSSQKFTRKLIDKYGQTAYWVKRGGSSREGLTRSQIFARNKFLAGDYDYLLSLESDVFPPVDFIQRLLSHGKHVVTGLYMIGDKSKGQRVPCITIKKYNEDLHAFGTRLLPMSEWDDYKDNGLKEVVAGGFGCCLIDRQTVEKIKFYYDPRFDSHSDVYFFNDCMMNGINTYVDTDLFCEHDNIPWETIKDR